MASLSDQLDVFRQKALPKEPTERFDGETYVPPRDGDRLTQQLARVKMLMLDERWRTLAQIAEETGSPQASVSARLRDLRKRRFGGYTVNRRYVRKGLFEYQVVL